MQFEVIRDSMKIAIDETYISQPAVEFPRKAGYSPRFIFTRPAKGLRASGGRASTVAVTIMVDQRLRACGNEPVNSILTSRGMLY